MSPPSSTFAQTFDDVADVQGWMTEAQAQRLWDRASELAPPAQIVEIGSYQGRSAIVFGRAAADGVEVVAIDPHAGNDRGPQQIHGEADEGQADHEVFLANLAAGRGGRDASATSACPPRRPTRPSTARSTSSTSTAPTATCPPGTTSGTGAPGCRDGRHAADPRLVQLGRGHPGPAHLLFFGGRFRYVGRSGSMTEYRRERLGPGERLANAGRQAAQLPWFVRNVVIKVLIVAKLGRFTRFLGHREPTWPF